MPSMVAMQPPASEPTLSPRKYRAPSFPSMVYVKPEPAQPVPQLGSSAGQQGRPMSSASPYAAAGGTRQQVQQSAGRGQPQLRQRGMGEPTRQRPGAFPAHSGSAGVNRGSGSRSPVLLQSKAPASTTVSGPGSAAQTYLSRGVAEAAPALAKLATSRENPASMSSRLSDAGPQTRSSHSGHRQLSRWRSSASVSAMSRVFRSHAKPDSPSTQLNLRPGMLVPSSVSGSSARSTTSYAEQRWEPRSMSIKRDHARNHSDPAVHVPDFPGADGQRPSVSLSDGANTMARTFAHVLRHGSRSSRTVGHGVKDREAQALAARPINLGAPSQASDSPYAVCLDMASESGAPSFPPPVGIVTPAPLRPFSQAPSSVGQIRRGDVCNARLSALPRHASASYASSPGTGNQGHPLNGYGFQQVARGNSLAAHALASHAFAAHIMAGPSLSGTPQRQPAPGPAAHLQSRLPMPAAVRDMRHVSAPIHPPHAAGSRPSTMLPIPAQNGGRNGGYAQAPDPRQRYSMPAQGGPVLRPPNASVQQRMPPAGQTLRPQDNSRLPRPPGDPRGMPSRAQAVEPRRMTEAPPANARHASGQLPERVAGGLPASRLPQAKARQTVEHAAQRATQMGEQPSTSSNGSRKSGRTHNRVNSDPIQHSSTSAGHQRVHSASAPMQETTSASSRSSRRNRSERKASSGERGYETDVEPRSSLTARGDPSVRDPRRLERRSVDRDAPEERRSSAPSSDSEVIRRMPSADKISDEHKSLRSAETTDTEDTESGTAAPDAPYKGSRSGSPSSSRERGQVKSAARPAKPRRKRDGPRRDSDGSDSDDAGSRSDDEAGKLWKLLENKLGVDLSGPPVPSKIPKATRKTPTSTAKPGKDAAQADGDKSSELAKPKKPDAVQQNAASSSARPGFGRSNSGLATRRGIVGPAALKVRSTDKLQRPSVSPSKATPTTPITPVTPARAEGSRLPVPVRRNAGASGILRTSGLLRIPSPSRDKAPSLSQARGSGQGADLDAMRRAAPSKQVASMVAAAIHGPSTPPASPRRDAICVMPPEPPSSPRRGAISIMPTLVVPDSGLDSPSSVSPRHGRLSTITERTEDSRRGTMTSDRVPSLVPSLTRSGSASSHSSGDSFSQESGSDVELSSDSRRSSRSDRPQRAKAVQDCLRRSAIALSRSSSVRSDALSDIVRCYESTGAPESKANANVNGRPEIRRASSHKASADPAVSMALAMLRTNSVSNTALDVDWQSVDVWTSRDYVGVPSPRARRGAVSG